MIYKKFRANQLFTGTEMLNADWVLIAKADGTIEEIVPFDSLNREDVLFFDEGIITPGLINCHCHLELSHLKGIIKEGSGMVDFILQILAKRYSYKEVLQDAILEANELMKNNGIVAVGDICNTTDTIEVKKKSSIYYHNFIEISGFIPEKAIDKFEFATEVYNSFEKEFPNQNSIVPHAPYSVSTPLFEKIASFDQNRILSIHNQECDAENPFFESKQGDFLRLYDQLNININFFKPTSHSSIQSIIQHIQTNTAILVHNGYITDDDLSKINHLKNTQKTQFWFCFCVLANKYIHNSLPQENLINNFCNQLVLGTDSLASNHSLNIVDELKYLHSYYPNVSIEVFLRAATLNGAKALGIEKNIGSFNKNKNPGIMLIKNLDNVVNLLTLTHKI